MSKLNTVARATLVALESTPSADGRSNYYKCAILQGAEVMSVSCTQDVFDAQPMLFKNYDFDVQISEYKGEKTLRVLGVHETPTTNATDPLGANKNIATPSGDKK